MKISTKYIQCFKNQIERNRPAVDYLTLVGKEKKANGLWDTEILAAL